MTRKFVLLVLFFSFVGCIPASPTSTTDAESAQHPKSLTAGRTRESTIAEVQADIRQRMQALHTGDVDTLLRYMPEESKRSAGEGGPRQLILNGIETIRALNVELESVEFPDPPKFAQTSERLFVLVPFTFVMRSRDRDKRVRIDDCSTGVLEKGASNFVYIERSMQIDELRRRYPDLPDNYRYPETGVTPLAD